MTLTITAEDPRSEAAHRLIAELSAEISRIYNDPDGSGGFSPEDALGPRAVFLIAWRDGVPVGSGALRPTEDADTVEIKRMYVRKHARRTGVARALLAALEQQARAFGYKRIILETGTPQAAAVRLYESAGYARIAPYGLWADDPLTACFGKALED